MKEELVVLVDRNDGAIGVGRKSEVHRMGQLHRAVSVFIINSKYEILLQQRAAEKYHSPLLWSNAACTHPREGESPCNAAERRLQEEMGMHVALDKILDFIYKAELGDGMVEHEFDHVFLGKSDNLPKINPNEVASYDYVSIDELLEAIALAPENYTEWFKIVLDRVVDAIKEY